MRLIDTAVPQCKSSNILITNRGVCKVGDFGLARVKNTTRSVIRSLVGTVNWQAPELWSPKPRYDYKVDVFSCAMVFWEMLAGWLTDKVSLRMRERLLRHN
jgi:serine/threonine protein kinase